MSLFLLLVAFALTGVSQISNRALIPLGLNDYIGLYSVGFWGAGVVVGFFMLVITRHETRRQDAALGMIMGVGGAIAMILLLLSLKTVPGMVAFPVRSCGNIALTAVISFFAWKERLSVRQWIGIACGIASIYLLV
ncbi:MAG: EamA family transporter [Armatimonadetes bacterium]|jgi:multidrug transporter EmrE-like cation transporter|nr:EamA family transporter [Armatimonadota bacterium]